MGAEEGPPTLVQPRAAGDGQGLGCHEALLRVSPQAQEPVSMEPSASLPPNPRHSSARPAARSPSLKDVGLLGKG